MMLFNVCRAPLGRVAGGLARPLLTTTTSGIPTSSVHASSSGVGPAEAAKEQSAQEADTDYNATPEYPNKFPRDAAAAQEAAMAASRKPHPSGAMDTSSVNDPAGRAEGSSYQEQQQQQGSSQQALHTHHPGREADVAGLQQHNSRPASSGSGAAPAAGVDAANILPGSEHAMTADFAAGGDDVNPPGLRPDGSLDEGSAGAAASVNPDTGLPQMGDASENAGAGSDRFGELKQPGDVGEEGMTARQTEHSTGMDPGGNAAS